jgi:hypothetical protein
MKTNNFQYIVFVCLTALLLLPGLALAQEAKPAKTPAQIAGEYLTDINRKVLDMAKDFPDDKYDFRLKPEMRSFGEVIIHIASGNVYASKAGRGEKVKWDELDPKQFKTKADIVAEFEKSAADADAAFKATSAAQPDKIEPWTGVMQHSSEHYGLLVAYFRANGIVPPESRPKK